MTLAPVLIFCYRRLESLTMAISALKSANLADKTSLYVFSDGYKGETDMPDVLAVREFLAGINGFKDVIITENPSNIGLAKNIISGVSSVMEVSDRVIVLEDDLVVSRNFLNFMNRALDHYETETEVFSISGYTPKVNILEYTYDTYFTFRSSSWGWATWKSQWDTVDWELKRMDGMSWKERLNTLKIGSDFLAMLYKQRRGEIDSWAVRWVFQQFLDNKVTVFPVLSKVNNIGVGDALATHTVIDDRRFETPLDESGKTSFTFREVSYGIDRRLLKQFNYYNSFTARVGSKLRNFLK
jgi:hypothetical protein